MEDKHITYRTPDPDSEITGLSIYRVGYSEVFPQFRLARPAKSVYTIKIVVAGQGMIRSYTHQQPFKSGDIVLYWKGCPYEWWTHPQDLLNHYWIDLDGRLVPDLFTQTAANPGNPVLPRDSVPPEEVALAKELMLACADNSLGSYWRCLSVFYAIWQSVISSLPEAGNLKKVRPIAENAKAFIDMHYTSHITLHDIAMSVGVAPGYLSALFTTAYGIAPYAYAIQRRLDTAQGLLAKGYRVQDVANSVGYSDTGYFARLFRRHFGYNPSAVTPYKKG